MEDLGLDGRIIFICILQECLLDSCSSGQGQLFGS